ncbi:hypothetical protein FBU30_001147, partial [Linnemannia zychae]
MFMLALCIARAPDDVPLESSSFISRRVVISNDSNIFAFGTISEVLRVRTREISGFI